MTQNTIDWEEARNIIEQEVALERRAQLEKWGMQKHSPEVWLAILTEEVGELATAALQTKFDGVMNAPKLQREATQIAAVAQAIVQCLRYGEA
jgi:NTP pyrophosphatase (non-canonical NTP hydrolase)